MVSPTCFTTQKVRIELKNDFVLQMKHVEPIFQKLEQKPCQSLKRFFSKKSQTLEVLTWSFFCLFLGQFFLIRREKICRDANLSKRRWCSKSYCWKEKCWEALKTSHNYHLIPICESMSDQFWNYDFEGEIVQVSIAV